jgi:hypothetical protein
MDLDGWYHSTCAVKLLRDVNVSHKHDGIIVGFRIYPETRHNTCNNSISHRTTHYHCSKLENLTRGSRTQPQPTSYRTPQKAQHLGPLVPVLACRIMPEVPLIFSTAYHQRTHYAENNARYRHAICASCKESRRPEGLKRNTAP